MCSISNTRSMLPVRCSGNTLHRELLCRDERILRAMHYHMVVEHELFISDMTSYYEMVCQIGDNQYFITAVFGRWDFWSSCFLFLLFSLLDILSLRGQYIWSGSLNWLVHYLTSFNVQIGGKASDL